MLDIYFWTTPNGYKVVLFAEEAGIARGSFRTSARDRISRTSPSQALVRVRCRAPRDAACLRAGQGDQYRTDC